MDLLESARAFRSLMKPGHVLSQKELDELYLSDPKKYIGIKDMVSAKALKFLTKETTVVHSKKAHYDVYIGRPFLWGNPFKIGPDGNRDEVIEKHRNWILTQPQLLSQIPSLRGKVLGCWCKPAKCHGDTLAALANLKEDLMKMTVNEINAALQSAEAKMVANGSKIKVPAATIEKAQKIMKQEKADPKKIKAIKAQALPEPKKAKVNSAAKIAAIKAKEEQTTKKTPAKPSDKMKGKKAAKKEPTPKDVTTALTVQILEILSDSIDGVFEDKSKKRYFNLYLNGAKYRIRVQYRGEAKAPKA